MSNQPSKIRVTNITRPGKGSHFLDPGEDFKNKLIAPGHSMLFATPGGLIPDFVEDWKAAGWIMIHNADTGGVLAGPVSGEITPRMVNPVRPATATDDLRNDDFFDEDPDLADAQEANLEPITGILGNTSQMSQARGARVSLGSRDEGSASGELSPIPGDRHVNLDEGMPSIRAPRSHAIGAVISSKR